MNFVKIKILNEENKFGLEEESHSVLFNTDNIVSIKPIRIRRGADIINGYWLRTVNNKKYRVVEIPTILEDLFEGEHVSTKVIDDIEANNSEFLENASLQ